MIYVIGSGPAGIAATVALLDRGLAVTILDGGIELEEERKLVVSRLAAQSQEEWSAADLTEIKGGLQMKASGIPLKLSYGSEFPYAETDSFIPRSGETLGIQPSLARGGLSNVWGAAMLPYRQEDILDWPIEIADLAPYYAKVISITGISAKHDSLADLFPLYCDNCQPLPQSSQIKAFMDDLERSRTKLSQAGFYFGASRLAVAEVSGRSCVRCRLCLYGCPYGLIYNSSQALEQLLANPKLTYTGGIVVNRLLENDGKVTISAIDRKTGSPLSIEAERVFVAAGVLSSTKIILKSLQAYDQPVTLRDSQYFLMPLLRFSPVSAIESEENYTLSQAFLEIMDQGLSAYAIHLQIYAYNEFYRAAIKAKLGLFFPIMALPTRMYLERMLLIQGYLHSEHSSTASLVLRKDIRFDHLECVIHKRPETEKILRCVSNKLFSLSQHLRAFPVPMLMRIGEHGRGYHAGSTLPMATVPAEFQTDLFGRPKGMKLVHVIDSSVFPSIPATTITLSVMANAYRIADCFLL
jgi:choline dehydrogenase-like flavoprotein